MSLITTFKTKTLAFKTRLQVDFSVESFVKAAQAGDSQTVCEMLDRFGKDIVNRKATSGWTAVQMATSMGHLRCLRLLLDRGADIEAKDSSGKTALLIAATYDQRACLQLLLERGADIEVKDKGDNEVIWFARWYSNPECEGILQRWQDEKQRQAQLEKEEHKNQEVAVFKSGIDAPLQTPSRLKLQVRNHRSV